jgi:hypothetical protein
MQDEKVQTNFKIIQFYIVWQFLSRQFCWSSTKYETTWKDSFGRGQQSLKHIYSIVKISTLGWDSPTSVFSSSRYFYCKSAGQRLSSGVLMLVNLTPARQAAEPVLWPAFIKWPTNLSSQVVIIYHGLSISYVPWFWKFHWQIVLLYIVIIILEGMVPFVHFRFQHFISP